MNVELKLLMLGAGLTLISFAGSVALNSYIFIPYGIVFLILTIVMWINIIFFVARKTNKEENNDD